ncbi:hypothetical protein [Brevibacillus sp. H7]|uniref:hypothetical protein n=1 Tax=Brevibacillus sp. H7 TaxID=3349138 RepID=UPI0037F7B276
MLLSKFRIILSLEQAEAERDRIIERLLLLSFSSIPNFADTFGRTFLEAAAARQTSSQKLPLSEWVLNEGEMLWVVSVLDASIPSMRSERNN